MQYELFYLVGERNELNLDTIREEVSQLLKEEGATLVDPELTEKRKLAYEIKHQKRGTYITRRFEMPEVDYWASEENAAKESGLETINRKLNLMNTVLRHMIVKTSELPEIGAKEKRQQMDQKEGRFTKKQESRPSRQDSRPFVRRETSKAPVAKVEEVKKEEVKKEEAPVVEEKVAETQEAPAKKTAKKEAATEAPAATEKPKARKSTKKESEDIDKQLEEILKI